jgi:histone-lysine N-methyltransferase SETD1
MTRPAGASFAQFFPAAPRAARDRAMERERAKMRAQESPSARPADTNGHRTPRNPSASSHLDDGPVAGFTSSSHVNGTAPHATRPPTDDTESLAGDTLNAGGSASSHTSASSSVFSAPTRPSASGALKRANNHQLTPPTTIASPSSYLSTAAPPKAQSTTPRRADGIDGLIPIPHGSVRDAPAFERVPARDPARSIKCIKRTYDPLLDTSLSSSEKRKTKPIYKEFGLVCTHDNFTLRGRGGRHLDCESIG